MNGRGDNNLSTHLSNPGGLAMVWLGVVVFLAALGCSPDLTALLPPELAGFLEPDPPCITLTIREVGGGTVARSGATPDADGCYADTDVVTLVATPDAGTSHVFVRWEGDFDSAVGNVATVTMNSDKIIYAVFSPQYELSINSIGGGSVGGDPPGFYPEDTPIQLVAQPDPGWRFVRWEGPGVNGETATSVSFTMDDHKRITAIFEPVGQQYTLTVNIVGQGTVGLNPAGGVYPADTDVTATATPASGWRFMEWDGDSLGITEVTTVKMTSAKTVTARFVPIAVRLTINVEGEGSIVPNPDKNGVYAGGEAVQLSAVPATGWRFDHWEGDLDGTANPATIIMNDNYEITAVFVPGNAPPIANDQDVSTAENAPVNITLTASDTDGDALTYRITAAPSNGQLDTTQLPLVVYTPAPGFTGTDSFSFRANDGQADSNQALVTISVGAAGQFTFYGVFDRITDTDSLGMHPWGYCVMSRNGQKIAFTASGCNCVFSANADGSNLQEHDMSVLTGVNGLAINESGSRIFTCGDAEASNDLAYVVKVEGGAVTPLPVGDLAVSHLRSTAAGDYAYFRGSYDIWRVRHDGSGLEKVVEDTAVPRDSGQSIWVGDYGISASGGMIAFEIQRYKLSGGSWATKEELFVLEGGVFRQLTNDDPKKGKDHVVLSPDASTVLFYRWSPSEWCTMSSAGGSATVIDEFPGGGSVVTNNDGGLLLDSHGQTIMPDGSLRHSFPYGWETIAGTLSMSSNADHVAFIIRTQSLPTNKYAMVVGHFNDPQAVADAPVIESATFTPAVMPTGDPDARVLLTIQVSDPQGLADLVSVGREPYVDGVNVRGNPPVYFTTPRDDGQAPDVTAGDGIYTAEGKPGSTIDAHDQMTIRVQARDAANTYVIGDVVLRIGG
ncbi:MAG: hypothetical protein KKB50_16115 [Planctomycetes bacterium]|nr:hypothetical protein [Planctomycetota bacterium]